MEIFACNIITSRILKKGKLRAIGSASKAVDAGI
jgi:hypothetical protein